MWKYHHDTDSMYGFSIMIDFTIYAFFGVIIATSLMRVNKVTSIVLMLYWLLMLIGFLIPSSIFSFHPHQWSDYFNINIDYHIDDLAKLFCVLISGIGILVFIYCFIYMSSDKKKMAKLLVILQLFALSMLFIVMTDNLVVLFTAWELTTVTSYLLIQFAMTDKFANQAALNGLLISVFGGLAMLAGFILLQQQVNTWSIQALITQVSASAPLSVVAFFLILTGAATKSAQFPFYFWLPGAMKAPTPVSAYLHSATMVNAGIYLLARFHPLFSSLPYWYPALASLGLSTMILGSVLSLFQTDLKAILAYTTLFILGSMVYLLADTHRQTIEAFIILLVFHSIYKAAAFMWVGSIDKSYGTRDIQQLGGIGRTWPLASALLVVIMAAMAGLPPLYGFTVKEMIYEAKLATGTVSYVMIGLSILTSMLIAAASCRVLFYWFFGRGTFIQKKQLRWAMLCPLLLCILILTITAFEPALEKWLVTTASNIVLSSDIDEPVYSTASFLLAIFTVFGGMIFFAVVYQLRIELVKWPLALNPRFLFEKTVAAILTFGNWLTAMTQEQSLSRQLTIIFSSLVLYLFILMPHLSLHDVNEVKLENQGLLLMVSLVMVITGITLLVNQRFIINMVSFTVLGFAMSAVFVIQGALDVAMTQLLVEILTVVILVLALRKSVMCFQKTLWPHYIIKFTLSTLLAGIILYMLLSVLQMPIPLSLSHYFIENALTKAHGSNVVNLILVDYRAFDTFGEVMVIVATAFAIWLLMHHQHSDLITAQEEN